jgi:hypothetical protein
MTQEFSAPTPEFPPQPALTPNEIVPMLIGSTVGEIERELVLQTLAPAPRACSGYPCAPCATRSGNIPLKESTCPRTPISARASQSAGRVGRRADNAMMLFRHGRAGFVPAMPMLPSPTARFE